MIKKKITNLEFFFFTINHDEMVNKLSVYVVTELIRGLTLYITQYSFCTV